MFFATNRTGPNLQARSLARTAEIKICWLWYPPSGIRKSTRCLIYVARSIISTLDVYAVATLTIITTPGQKLLDPSQRLRIITFLVVP